MTTRRGISFGCIRSRKQEESCQGGETIAIAVIGRIASGARKTSAWQAGFLMATASVPREIFVANYSVGASGHITVARFPGDADGDGRADVRTLYKPCPRGSPRSAAATSM